VVCLVTASSALAQTAQPAGTAGAGAAQPTPSPGDDVRTAEAGGDAHPDLIAPAPPTGDTFWFGAEYLLWKVKGMSVPTLVGQISATQAELIQAFPSSNITPLFGGGAAGISYDAQSGLRLETGLWLDDARQFGVAVGFFQLAQGRQHFQADSQGQQALGPVFFYDSAFSQEAILMDGVPGLREGTVSVDASQHLWGAEVNALHALSTGGVLDHLELFAGFRYLQFSEGLTISGTSRAIPGGALPCG
jgi:hypothetical protein